MSRKSKSIGSSVKDSNRPATGAHHVNIARRIARAGAAVLLMAVLSAGGFVYYANRTAPSAQAIGEISPPSPKAAGIRQAERKPVRGEHAISRIRINTPEGFF